MNKHTMHVEDTNFDDAILSPLQKEKIKQLFEVGSGTYHWSYTYRAEEIHYQQSLQSTISEFINDPEAQKGYSVPHLMKSSSNGRLRAA